LKFLKKNTRVIEKRGGGRGVLKKMNQRDIEKGVLKR